MTALQGIDLDAVWKSLWPNLSPTTFIESERLDQALGIRARMLLLSETFQRTGSFKFRAAMSLCLHTQATELQTASSGNFGAALALAAAKTGKQCTVVMPAQSAAVKIGAVRAAGAIVDLIDTKKITRAERLLELQRQNPRAQVVSPYDDLYVIAGNATLGAELFSRETPDCVAVPVGGGGLSSGMVVARNHLSKPSAIIGAEPLLANDAARSLREGRLCSNPAEANTLCDGARTLSLGKLNFQILRNGLSEIVEVDEATIARAVRMLFQLVNLKAEPTGALALAAVLQSPEKFAGKRVACVVSGGNVDSRVYCDLMSMA
jgi:threonine dehydratase